MTTLSNAFVKARHLETITLPMIAKVKNQNQEVEMESGDGEHDVPYVIKPVLPALTKLPALKSLTLDMDSCEVRCVFLNSSHACIVISPNNHILIMVPC